MSKNQRAPFVVFCMVAILCGFVMVATARGEALGTPRVSLDGRAYATQLIERTPLGGSSLLESGPGSAPGEAPGEAPAEDAPVAAIDATDGSLSAGEPPMTAATGGVSGTGGEWSTPDATSGGRAGRGPAASGAGSSDDPRSPVSWSGSTGGAGGAVVDDDGSAEGPDPSADPAPQPGPAPAAPWTPPVKGGTPAVGGPDGDDGPGDDGPSVGESPALPPAPAEPAVPTLPIVPPTPPTPPIVCEPRVEEDGPSAVPVEPVVPAEPTEPVVPAEPTT